MVLHIEMPTQMLYLRVGAVYLVLQAKCMQQQQADEQWVVSIAAYNTDGSPGCKGPDAANAFQATPHTPHPTLTAVATA